MTDLASLHGHTTLTIPPTGPGSHDAHVLAGINRILQEALRASTEEELGRLCLEVAEDLTGAAFSFFGERRESHDRLDHIAISERGWAAYEGAEPVFRQRQLPNGLNIHGIFGQVILQDRSLIVNDPASHPNRVGTPEGIRRCTISWACRCAATARPLRCSRSATIRPVLPSVSGRSPRNWPPPSSRRCCASVPRSPRGTASAAC
ncbi:GAF domain-containing protein [Sphingomonas sp. I4]